MLTEKRRTDDDWRELGEHIYRARKGLADAWVKSSRVFGNRDPHTIEVKKLYESLGGLMVELDSRYSHDGAEWTFGNPSPIGDWMKERLGWALEIVKPPRRWVRVPPGEEPPPYPRGFIVLPRRWVVERTFAWILRNRRMSRDYEFLAETTEALIYVAMVRLMVRRLAKGTA